VNAADYSAVERLRDGRMLEIRALQSVDRAGLLAAFERTSDESRYRRFFAPKRAFSERELEFFMNVDFATHVALAATIDDGAGQVIVGGGRYIASKPGSAELAFVVDDAHQNLGIATHLLRHLVFVAQEAGIGELVADVLPENTAMLKVLERCSVEMTVRREAGIVHVTLDLSRRRPRAEDPA
jgi:RimJ/RimL family protein N-acetyltransferase